MKTYRDAPEYVHQSRRLQWLEIEAAKITNALDKINLEYVRDSIYASATVRAELAERRSDYRLEAKQILPVLATIKERYRASHEQSKYDTLVTLLNNKNLAHLVIDASNLRKSEEFA